MYNGCRCDGNCTLPPSFTIISFTCFAVVQPSCSLSFGFFFILTAISRGSLDGVSTAAFMYFMYVFESLYTFFFCTWQDSLKPMFYSCAALLLYELESFHHLQPSSLGAATSPLHLDLLLFCIDVSIHSCEKKPCLKKI